MSAQHHDTRRLKKAARKAKCRLRHLAYFGTDAECGGADSGAWIDRKDTQRGVRRERVPGPYRGNPTLSRSGGAR